MEKRPCITAAQMFSMLFISRMVVSVMYGALLVDNSELWDHIVSVGICFVLTWGMLVPIYYLFSMNKKMNVLDEAFELFGKIAYVISALYGIYFLSVSFHTVVMFGEFISNAVNPPIFVPLLSVLLLMSACYGAYKGLEALARASGIILIAMILAIIFVGISLSHGIESVNYKPIMYSGAGSVISGVKFMISQSTCLPALAILLPSSKGNRKLGAVLWNTGVYVVFGAIIFLIVGTMGDFVKVQLFPVYSAAGIGKFGSFKHLDFVYLGVWICAMFLKQSLFIFLASQCVKKIWGEGVRKKSILFFGLLLSISAFFVDKLQILKQMFITDFLFVFLIVIVLIIPTILAISKKIKNSKECVTLEK